MTYIKVIFGTYKVRPFTNVDPDYSGYNVYDENEQAIGEMVCDHYDLEDEETLIEFEKILEDWLMDNE